MGADSPGLDLTSRVFLMLDQRGLRKCVDKTKVKLLPSSLPPNQSKLEPPGGFMGHRAAILEWKSFLTQLFPWGLQRMPVGLAAPVCQNKIRLD